MIHHDPDTHPVNRDLIELAFRQAGIVSTNTSEQDIHLVTEYTLAAIDAQKKDQAPPVITDKLVDAVQRATIRAAARGEMFNLAFGLAAAVKERRREREEALPPALDPENPTFLEDLIGMRLD